MAWMTSLNPIIRGDVEVPAKTTFECSPDEAKQLDALKAARPATADEVSSVRGPDLVDAGSKPKGDAK